MIWKKYFGGNTFQSGGTWSANIACVTQRNRDKNDKYNEEYSPFFLLTQADFFVGLALYMEGHQVH